MVSFKFGRSEIARRLAKLLLSYLFISTELTRCLFLILTVSTVQFVFLTTLAAALAAPGYVSAPLAAPLVSPYAYTAHAAYAAPLTAAYTGIGYPAYSPISAPVVSAAYYG
jgi:hypothetical protein